MIKRIIILLLSLAITAGAFTGCGKAAAEQNNNVSIQSNQYSADDAAVSDVITMVETNYEDADINSSYSEDGATVINLNDGNTSIEGSGAKYTSGKLNIINAGTYILSGKLEGQVVVDATSVDEVRIVLDNAEISNDAGPAIYVKQAEKVTLTLASGSENTVTDGKTYSENKDSSPDAAIYSTDRLIINGDGELTVNGNYKHGIKSSDSITIISGTVNVYAANDGIRGKDFVSVLSGVIKIEAAGDGITATNADDSEKGWISIDGGTFNISAGNNGIQAETSLTVNAGELKVSAQQDTYHCNNDILITGGSSVLSAADDGMHADNILQITGGYIEVVESYEGIEGSNVYISGGEIRVEATDDGINAAGGTDAAMPQGDRFNMDTGSHILAISGGKIYISCIGSEGDGLDSNGDIYISGGLVEIDGSVSRMDSAIDINRGTFEYSGGVLQSFGGSSMLVIPTVKSQPVITIIFDGNQQSGKQISVKDSSGNIVMEFTPEKAYSVAMLSTPEMKQGKVYTLIQGKTELFTITLSEISMTVDGSGNITEVPQQGGGAMPAGPGGGMPGGDRGH